MSSKRLRTDLGPLSLELVEMCGSESKYFGDANAGDVLRLSGLLRTTQYSEEESRPHEEASRLAVMGPGLVEGEIKTRLDELVDALAKAIPGIEGAASRQASITLRLSGVGEINVVIDNTEGKLTFELHAVEPDVHEWLESVLHLLRQYLIARLGEGVRLCILAPPACERAMVGTARHHGATA